MIKLLFMDIDGTLTDGKIYMSPLGELFKAFDIKDGCGIHDLLPQMGIIPVVITGRESKIAEYRCRELGIEYLYQNCRDKAEKLRETAEMLGAAPDEKGKYPEAAYIGDDINDLPCMQICGFVGCPADAADEVKSTANFVACSAGGHGAVREFIEFIKQKGMK